MPLSTVISGDKLPDYMIYVFLIALVGLWDDFVTRFQPTSRLVLVLAISIFAFLSDAVPMTESAYGWLPLGLNNAFALMLAGALVVTGFVNAGNMADGANGLLCIIGVSFLSVFMSYDSTSFASMFILALLIFLIFNVATGRIFLGDFGAYGLSAVIAFSSLELYPKATFRCGSWGVCWPIRVLRWYGSLLLGRHGELRPFKPVMITCTIIFIGCCAHGVGIILLLTAPQGVFWVR